MKHYPLEVETMTREELIKNYYDVIAAYEDFAGTNDDLVIIHRLLREIGSVYGLPSEYTTRHVARLLNALKSGHEISWRGAVLALNGPIEFECVSVKPVKHAHIMIHRLRRALNPVGIKIETIWGEGLIMRKDEISKLNYLLENGVTKP